MLILSIPTSNDSISTSIGTLFSTGMGTSIAAELTGMLGVLSVLGTIRKFLNAIKVNKYILYSK